MVPINMKDINEKLREINKLSVSEIVKAVDNDKFYETEITKEKRDFNKLSPEMKSVISAESIRNAVKKHGLPDGLTIDEIVELTDLTRKTVEKHLKTLCNLREVYSIKKGKRMTLFFPNGKPLWGVGSKRFEWGNTIFEVTLARGFNEKLFFHILEKRYSILDGEKPEGGILLPVEGIFEFTKELEKLAKKVDGE